MKLDDGRRVVVRVQNDDVYMLVVSTTAAQSLNLTPDDARRVAWALMDAADMTERVASHAA